MRLADGVRGELVAHAVVELRRGSLYPRHDSREHDADVALAHLWQTDGDGATRGALGALALAQGIGVRRAGRFGIFALAQGQYVLGEVAAVVQGVEGHVEVAVDDEDGL